MKIHNRHTLAELFSVSAHTIDRWCRDGKLTPTRINQKSVYFTESEVERFLDSHTNKGGE